MIPVNVTRDLVHFRKLPAKATALAAVATSFLNLVASDEHPSAPSLRAAFLPALTGSDLKPRDPAVTLNLDRQVQTLLRNPPTITLVQAVLTPDQIEHAWKAGPDSILMSTIVLAFPLHQELERAKAEGAKEETANLSMLVIATLAHELAHWIFVKVHGYQHADPMSDTASLHTTATQASMSSLQSNGSLLVPSRNKHDVGFRAVMALIGCDYELLTYAIGERQLVKRRYPTRRSATLTPPLVYYLIGDTPAIVDVTSWPPTAVGMIPPFKEGDSMYAITSVLTPSGIGKSHGLCMVVASGDGASSVGGSTLENIVSAAGA
ncbi:uncharacterized protein JCM15063_002449 [Sporobolomyces koalae]|uniref:uncharacterized protein n=1 Tax=Sporobolomyces koalae TaxID=500713 RepID=UPI003175FC95